MTKYSCGTHDEFQSECMPCEMAKDFQALKAENARLREALEGVARYQGMTNLHDCCVDKTCTPIFEDGELVGHCAFAFGVNRGFNECAGIARAALEGKE